MALEVDILDVGSDGGRVEATVAVTETGSENTDYTLEIVDESAPVTGGRVVATESGTVFGGSRGTQASYDVSFEPGQNQGTFRAEVTEQQGLFDPGAPQRDSDRADFEVSDSGGDPGGEATITILDVEAEPTTVTVVVRVLSLSLGRTDYSGSVSLDWGPGSDFVSISGTVGSGAGADEKTIEFIASNFSDEAFLTAALDNGEQEQRTISIPGGGSGGGGEEPPTDDPGGGGGGDDPGSGGGGGSGGVSVSDFEVDCISTSIPDRAVVGDSTTVTYTVDSFADQDAVVKTALVVNGQQVGTDQVDMPAGVTGGTAGFDIEFTDTGDSEIEIQIIDAQA